MSTDAQREIDDWLRSLTTPEPQVENEGLAEVEAWLRSTQGIAEAVPSETPEVPAEFTAPPPTTAERRTPRIHPRIPNPRRALDPLLGPQPEGLFNQSLDTARQLGLPFELFGGIVADLLDPRSGGDINLPDSFRGLGERLDPRQTILRQRERPLPVQIATELLAPGGGLAGLLQGGGRLLGRGLTRAGLRQAGPKALGPGVTPQILPASDRTFIAPGQGLQTGRPVKGALPQLNQTPRLASPAQNDLQRRLDLLRRQRVGLVAEEQTLRDAYKAPFDRKLNPRGSRGVVKDADINFKDVPELATLKASLDANADATKGIVRQLDTIERANVPIDPAVIRGEVAGASDLPRSARGLGRQRPAGTLVQQVPTPARPVGESIAPPHAEDFSAKHMLGQQKAAVQRRPNAKTKPAPDVPPGPGKMELLAEVANVPRAAMTTLDQSAWLRQNLLLSISHPKRFGDMTHASMRAMFSEQSAREIDQGMKAGKWFKRGEDTGLFHASLDDTFDKEEVLYGQRILRNILRGDVAGRQLTRTPGRMAANAVRGSERAYTTATNTMRQGVFSDVMDAWEDAARQGADLSWFKRTFNGDVLDDKVVKSLSNYLNVASGRGNLGPFSQAGRWLSAAFFAPRLAISHIQLLGQLIAPRTAAPVRALIAKDLSASVGAVSGAITALSFAPGVRTDADPRSSDFGKLVIGNTRFDFTGGMGGVIRLAARIKSGEIKSITDAKIKQRDWEKSVMQYIGFKLSPQVQMVKNVGIPLAKGERPTDFLGREIHGSNTKVVREIAKEWAPLFIQDMLEAYQDTGLVGLGVAAPASFIGLGVQTIKPRSPEDQAADRASRTRQGLQRPGNVNDSLFESLVPFLR